VRVLRLGGAAPDHPLDPGYPEGAYLTNLTVLVE
jgi:23S rRNA G2069 N7-methylase RlmK/C1962 C5-methylase RlmI